VFKTSKRWCLGFKWISHRRWIHPGAKRPVSLSVLWQRRRYAIITLQYISYANVTVDVRVWVDVITDSEETQHDHRWSAVVVIVDAVSAGLSTSIRSNGGSSTWSASAIDTQPLLRCWVRRQRRAPAAEWLVNIKAKSNAAVNTATVMGVNYWSGGKSIICGNTFPQNKCSLNVH